MTATEGFSQTKEEKRLSKLRQVCCREDFEDVEHPALGTSRAFICLGTWDVEEHPAGSLGPWGLRLPYSYMFHL